MSTQSIPAAERDKRRLCAATPLLLGSASPRRRDILSGLGLPLFVRPSHAPETLLPNEAPDAFIERVVEEKLAAVLAAGGFAHCAAALAADTIVLADNEVLGKPVDTREALAYLQRLSGKPHVVKTRFVVALPNGERRAQTVSSEVLLRAASRAELERYAETGEGLDKAGGYAAQGIGAFLVQSIRGSYTNVVGLPACEVIEVLGEMDLLHAFPGPVSNDPSNPSF
jgi:septum formation protein